MATLQNYFDQLPQEIKDAIDTTGLDLTQPINDSKFEKTTQEHIVNYGAQANDNYGSGVYEDISTLISKKTAEQRTDTNFFNPFSNNPVPSADLTNGKTKLITGIVSCVENDKFDDKALKKLLKDSNFASYDSVVIPLGIKSGDNEGGPNHAISLIINPKTKEVLFVDQAGENGSKHYVKELKNLVQSLGYPDTNIEVYQDKIMDNRDDCAIFAAFINEMALKARDIEELKQNIGTFKNKDENDKKQEIDQFNGQCKTSIEQDLFDEYKNNLLFQRYALSQSKNINNISSEDMRDLIVKFADLNSMTVDGNTNQDQAHIDPIEAEEIRKAIEHANQVLSYDFKEAEEDPNYPGHLVFKDSAKPENRIIFASKSQAFVEGDQKSFDELIVAAKKLNRTKVNFGNFENKPQDKAKLYLACLKYDMNMGGNIPTEQELRNCPEWPQIEFINATKEAAKTFTEMLVADKERNEDSDWKLLKQEMDDAKTALDADPNNQQLQNDYTQKQQAFNDNEKQKTYIEKQQTYKQNLEQAKTLSETPASKDQIKKLPQFSKFKFMDLREGIRDVRKKLTESQEYKDFAANPNDQTKKAALEGTDIYKNYTELMAELVENDPKAQERKDKIIQLSHNPNRADILTQRDGESDADFNDRKDAVEKENWEKIIKQRQGETPNDYQTRKNETLQQIQDQKPTRTAQKELNQAVFKKLTDRFQNS